MKKKIVTSAFLLFLCLTAGGAKADDVNDLKQQMAEQSRKLQEMQQKLEMLETQQTQQNKTIEAAALKNKTIITSNHRCFTGWSDSAKAIQAGGFYRTLCFMGYYGREGCRDDVSYRRDWEGNRRLAGHG